MTDEPINDADTHAVWEALNAADPHRIRIDHLTRTEIGMYLGWHKARLRTINATMRALGRSAPARQDPVTRQQITHHKTLIRRLRAMLPAPPVPKPKPSPQPTAADQAAARAREIATYAHREGLSIRQAVAALEARRTSYNDR